MRTKVSLTCWTGYSTSPTSTNCTDRGPSSRLCCVFVVNMGFANIIYLRRLIPLVLLRRGPAAARLLGFRFRLCVLSGRGLCVGLITRPGESYRL